MKPELEHNMNKELVRRISHTRLRGRSRFGAARARRDNGSLRARRAALFRKGRGVFGRWGMRGRMAASWAASNVGCCTRFMPRIAETNLLPRVLFWRWQF